MEKLFTVSIGPMLVHIDKSQLSTAIEILRYKGGTLADRHGRIIQTWKADRTHKTNAKLFL